VITVTLDWAEVMRAAQVGLRRQVEALRDGKRDRAGFKGDGWGIHIEGALGECAYAKAMNVYWSGHSNVYHTIPDVGTAEVRCRSRHDYELLIRRDDPDDRPFVLVTGSCPDFRVVGWIKGEDAKRPEWLQTHGNRPGAYFVPHHALTPITP
jgi:hypothetical protein